MNKSPEAFRTISEVAEALTVPPHVLRFWETRFPQVKPVKRGGGRRYYRPEDVKLLRGIRGLLYEDGITIKGVQKILRERGVRHVISLGAQADGVETAAAAPLDLRPDAAPEAAGAGPPSERAADLAGPGAGPVGSTSPARPRSQEDPPLPENAEPATDAQELPAWQEEAPLRRPGGMDKAALRTLLEKLEALRGTMTASPDA